MTTKEDNNKITCTKCNNETLSTHKFKCICPERNEDGSWDTQEKKCEHGVVAKYCFRCKRPDLAGEPKGTPTASEWESEFDKEFNFWKDVTITPRQAGDFERASILQKYYRNTGERLKDFIRQLLQARDEELKAIIDRNMDVMIAPPNTEEKSYLRGWKDSLTNIRVTLE